MVIAGMALLLALIYGPSLWVRWVMRRHRRDRPELSGTGGELAEHLLERFGVEGCAVEIDPRGVDHFDPNDNRVRLSKDNYYGKSITAVAVAAHEVGHALQCSRQERIFQLRRKYLPAAATLRRLGLGFIAIFPLLALLLKAPPLIAVAIAIGVLLQLAGAMMYLIVLPEEWDASFNKALPLLRSGYIGPDDVPAAEQVLRAAALTYFAAALADVLNVARWLLLLLRR